MTEEKYILIGLRLLAVSICIFVLLVGKSTNNRRVDQALVRSESRNSGVQLSLDSTHRPRTSFQSPLKFVENRGQTAEPVRFTSHGAGYELFLTQQDAVLALNPAHRLDLSPTHRTAFFRARRAAREKSKASFVRLHLTNSNPENKIAGLDPVPDRIDYFVGSDPAKWQHNVPAFARVKYVNVYPGVDLVFYGNQRQIEYDFIVAPGADPKAIDLSVEGPRNLRVNSRGDLLLGMRDGEIAFHKPVVYQELHGQRREIAARYKLSPQHRVSFEVASYDSGKPLIIDPVLSYSTYLGGEGEDSGSAVALDAAGNAVVVGTTLSLQFPTTSGALTPGPLTSNANGLVFVTEIDPTGTKALYSSYVGGTGGDFGFAVAVDPTGKIYVTGETDSTDFPTTANALKPGPNPGNTNGSSFVFKIDPALVGTASLLYSSYLGGTQSSSAEFGNGIATDADGIAYVVGVTGSQPGGLLANFPVTALTAFQAVPGSGIANGTAFLTKLDMTQAGAASLLYSTYLGGNGTHSSGPGFGDSAFAVAEDPAGKTYLTGTTTSTDFPTTPTAFQQSAPAAIAQGTAFVSSFDTTQTGAASLLYSSYLGGETADFGDAIALGPSNVAYVTGSTSSLSFPTTPGAFQTTGNAASITFVSLLDTAQSGKASLKYSSFLGGSQTNTAVGISADSSGNAYVVGSSHGADFPATPFAFQNGPAPGSSGAGFVTKLSPTGQGTADLIYSTYFGGNGANGTVDEVNGVALNSAQHAIITGDTVSATAFPVTPVPGAFQTTLNGPSDAFVAEITFQPVLTISPLSLTFGSQSLGTPSAAQPITLTNNSVFPIAFTSAVISDGAPAAADSDFTTSNTCGDSIPVNASCAVSVVFTPSVIGSETASLVISDAVSPNPQTLSLTGSGANAVNFALTPSTASLTVAQGASGTFKLTVTPTGGFHQAVALACAGAPAMSTCTVTPPSITPTDGATPVVTTVTVATQASTAVVPPPAKLILPLAWQAVTAALAITFLFLRSRRFKPSIRLGFLAVSVSLLFAIGCGGGSHNPPASGGTPKGTSKLTLTGTSGTLTNSTTVTLTVN